MIFWWIFSNATEPHVHLKYTENTQSRIDFESEFGGKSTSVTVMVEVWLYFIFNRQQYKPQNVWLYMFATYKQPGMTLTDQLPSVSCRLLLVLTLAPLGWEIKSIKWTQNKIQTAINFHPWAW